MSDSPVVAISKRLRSLDYSEVKKLSIGSVSHRRGLYFLLLLIAMSYFIPTLVLAISSTLILFFLLVEILRLRDTNRLKHERLKTKPQLAKVIPIQPPAVTIHIPICNEDPQIVMATLRQLVHLNYERFEVIVVDNNSAPDHPWEPVSQLCQQLGPRFRYFRFPAVKGYKAGAMNIALQLTSSECEFILTVDADYLVHRNLLRDAVRAASETDVGYVQFPQNYTNISKRTEGIARNLANFFSLSMTTAQERGVPLMTGTLSLVRVSALIDIGCWQKGSITEDADTSFEMLKNGWRGVYCDSDRGQGVMPDEIEKLKKQRLRWSAGNAQVLRKNLSFFFKERDLSLTEELVKQLTYWHNPLLLVFICGLIGSITASAEWLTIFWSASGLFLLAHLVLKILRQAISEEMKGFSTIAEILKIEVSLYFTEALGFIKGFLSVNLKFVGAAAYRVRGGKKSSGDHNHLMLGAVMSAVGIYYQAWPLLIFSLCFYLPSPVPTEKKKSIVPKPPRSNILSVSKKGHSYEQTTIC